MTKVKVVHKSKKSGKFVVNPNSKRQKKLREQEAAKQAAVNGSPVAPSQSHETTAGPSDNADTEAIETIPIVTVNEPAQEPSHTADWFPPPPLEPEIIDEIEIEENDDSDNSDDKEKPRPSRAKRARSKMLADKFVEGTSGIFSIYVGARHAEWIAAIGAHLRAQGEDKKADMLTKLGELSETEKTVLSESVARYIEENNIELSPGAELVVLFGSMYVGRIVALEGTLIAMKKGGKA